MNSSTLLYSDRILNEFKSLASELGWGEHEREGLVVPYFRTEFNRCVEHLELNRLINASCENSSGWHQVGPACRTNDMRKVESGWHSTVFEVLALAGSYPPTQKGSALKQLTTNAINFLTERLKLDIKLLRVTFFGGGEVIPGEVIAPAGEWRDLWLNAGVLEKNLIPVHGPKNYVLFVGDGERCGPKCEVMYQVNAQGRPKWLEVGTLIFDDSQISRDENGGWSIRRANSVVAGAAYGFERLTAACMNAADLTDIPTWKNLIEVITRRVKQPDESMPLMHGDVLVLADQVRACTFLCAAGAVPDQTARGRSFAVMLRRIRRKIATLCIDDWQALTNELEAELVKIYGGRYPELENARGMVQALIAEVEWPEGWNPESYVAK